MISRNVLVRDVNGHEVETYEDADGWHWQSPRRIPRHEPHGPFTTEDDALSDAAARAADTWHRRRHPRLMREASTPSLRARLSKLRARFRLWLASDEGDLDWSADEALERPRVRRPSLVARLRRVFRECREEPIVWNYPNRERKEP